MSVLVVTPAATWVREPSSASAVRTQLGRHLRGRYESIALTPSARLWVGDVLAQQVDEPNALGSALVAFLQLPVRQLRGTACITGWTDQRARPLTTVQDRAFTQALRAVVAMPAYLALHAQAGRVAAAWDTPPPTSGAPREHPTRHL